MEIDGVQLPTQAKNWNSFMANTKNEIQKDFKILTENPKLWKKTLELYEKEAQQNGLIRNSKNVR